jgi:hypothetical protein
MGCSLLSVQFVGEISGTEGERTTAGAPCRDDRLSVG